MKGRTAAHTVAAAGLKRAHGVWDCRGRIVMVGFGWGEVEVHGVGSRDVSLWGLVRPQGA